MRTHAVLLLSLLAVGCGSSPSEQPGGDAASGDSPIAEASADSPNDTADASTDPIASKRASCAFAAGAKVQETLGFGAENRAKLPISHVIVLMKENRSFDHYFGKLGRPDVEPLSEAFPNPDDKGLLVTPTHESNACFPYDPGHQWANMHAMWDGGKLDGFVKNAIATSVDKDGKTAAKSDGRFVMSYRERADLPFYYWLTDQFAMADHWHCSALAGTWANRLYLYAGSSYGVKNTGGEFVPSGTKTIFDALDAASVTYGMYSDDAYPLDGTLFPLGITMGSKGVFKVNAFYDALAAGTLPQVVFLDASLNALDEHPPGDVQKGEAFTKEVYDAVVKSPLWLKDGKGVALIWTYDETGGFFDHLPPPKACVASPDQSEFDRLGFRVPFVMISPFAKKRFVSHKIYDHTAITRFIEMIRDFPAMTARDANAESLLDFLDFAAAPNAKPDVAPAAGSGGCK